MKEFQPLHYARVVYYRKLRPALWRSAQPLLGIPQDSKELRHLLKDPYGSDAEFLERFYRDVAPRLPFTLRGQDESLRRALATIMTSEAIQRQAEQAEAHQLRLLEDSYRDYGRRIDWHRDYVSGYTWSREPSHRIDFLNSPAGADVKNPWEVNRCQWWLWLGMAYLDQPDERWSDAFRHECEGWITDNPLGRGINWAMPMEVAIRAVNWIFVYAFFYGADSIGDDFWLRFLRVLYSHGRYLEFNLEYVRHPGNHFASNCLGLVALGCFFYRTDAGRRWLQTGMRMLEREMQRQVYPDGVSYEKSTAYHRLVMEIFSLARIFADGSGIDFSTAYLQRLEAMYNFTAAACRTDGSVPAFGDADNGRILRFFADEDFNDHRANLALGAAMFQRADLAAAAQAPSPDLLFTMGPAACDSLMALRQTKVSFIGTPCFDKGGYIIHRSPLHHLMIDVGDYGMDGWGGHGHNDCLSFEFWLLGQCLLCDSGTGVYTADPAMRNSLRATRAHNTVEVGGAEQVEFGGLWRIKKDETAPRQEIQQSSDQALQMTAFHQGYLSRFQALHRRRFDLNEESEGGTLQIDDQLECSAAAVKGFAFFHLHPSLPLEETAGRIKMALPDGTCEIESSRAWEILTMPYSPSYGIIASHQVLKIPCDCSLTIRWKRSPT